MKDLLPTNNRGNGYNPHFLTLKTTSREFRFSRRQPLGAGEKIVPSNIAAHAHATASGVPQLETLIGGVLQGRKASDIRGASRVSRFRMWELALEVAALVAVPRVQRALGRGKYGEVKGGELLEGRRRVKEDVREGALKGWVRNLEDESWSL
jgi:tRNA-specific adenosine deaminase 1